MGCAPFVVAPTNEIDCRSLSWVSASLMKGRDYRTEGEI